MQKEAEVGGWYSNKKTGQVYVVLYNALASWDSYQNLVVYKRKDKEDGDQVWVRSLAEFNEKFELLD
jgi:hypothetical protein